MGIDEPITPPLKMSRTRGFDFRLRYCFEYNNWEQQFCESTRLEFLFSSSNEYLKLNNLEYEDDMKWCPSWVQMHESSEFFRKNISLT